MNWQSNFIQTNGIRLHYTRTGGDKPALLMLHGITDSGPAWNRTASALAADYDCLLVDGRGHGLSDKPADGYHSDDYAADFAGLIEGLGLGSVLVMGHSLGAINAATLAGNYPHLVRGAVLEDPPWRDRNDTANQMTPEQTKKWMEEWRAGLIAQQQQSLEEIIAAGQERSPLWRADEFPEWAMGKQQVNPDVLTKGVLRTWEELVPRIGCPALLVSGDPAQGGIVTPGLAAIVCAANPHFRHAHIPGTGHNIRRDDFDAYIQLVRAFLAGIAPTD